MSCLLLLNFIFWRRRGEGVHQPTFLFLSRFPLDGSRDGPPLDSSRLCTPCVLDEIQSAGDVSALRSMKSVILDKVNRGEIEVSAFILSQTRRKQNTHTLVSSSSSFFLPLLSHVQVKIESGYLVDKAWFRRWRLKKSLEIRQVFLLLLLLWVALALW